MVEGGRKEKPSAALAGTRPVFRGLRQEPLSAQERDPGQPPCKDETRFQGIATSAWCGKRWAGPWCPCKDETRFQGIATTQMRDHHSICLHRLARTRPVFRGLRLIELERDIPQAIGMLAGTRPVFRGLRVADAPQQRGQPLIPSCKDETRFQGIATGVFFGGTAARISRALQGRDPLSGDCDRRLPLSLRGGFRSLQGRDPFSGDCNVGATRRVAPAF